MREIRIHGRGGQGSVVTAELLAMAAFESGNYSQAFPYLGGGGERRGAPVQSFVRISDRPIRLRSKIHEPDYVIVKDASLAEVVELWAGLKTDGLAIVNSRKPPEDCGFPGGFRVVTVPATDIALRVLGSNMINTAMLGAFAAITGEVTIDAISRAISTKFSGEVAEKNVLAAQTCFRYVCDAQAKVPEMRL